MKYIKIYEKFKELATSPFFYSIRKNKKSGFGSTDLMKKKYPYIKTTDMNRLSTAIYDLKLPNEDELFDELLIGKYIQIYTTPDHNDEEQRGQTDGMKKFIIRDTSVNKQSKKIYLHSVGKKYEVKPHDTIIIYCKNLDMGPEEKFAIMTMNYNL